MPFPGIKQIALVNTKILHLSNRLFSRKSHFRMVRRECSVLRVDRYYMRSWVHLMKLQSQDKLVAWKEYSGYALYSTINRVSCWILKNFFQSFDKLEHMKKCLYFKVLPILGWVISIPTKNIKSYLIFTHFHSLLVITTANKLRA